MAIAFALDFEKPLAELDRQIDELKRIGAEGDIDVSGEVGTLEAKLASMREEIYRNLTPMQRVQVARHPRRPYALDYLATIFTDFIELHGIAQEKRKIRSFRSAHCEHTEFKTAMNTWKNSFPILKINQLCQSLL